MRQGFEKTAIPHADSYKVPSMYRRLIPSAVALATSVSMFDSQAAELIIAPKIFSGVTYIDYKQEAGLFLGTTFGDFKVSGFSPLLGGGLGIKYSPFYFDVYGQHTFQGQDSDDLTVTVQPNSRTLPFGQQLDLDSKYKRSDINAVVGYEIRSKDNIVFGQSVFSIFAGYKYANADINNKVTKKGDVPYVLPLRRSVNGNLDIDLTYHGLLTGVNYSFPIDSLDGRLSFSSALTYYLANIKLNLKTSAGSPISSSKGDDDATSVGYNFQINWVGDIRKDLYYTLGVNISKSDFDTKGDISDFAETEYRLNAGLEYSIK